MYQLNSTNFKKKRKMLIIHRLLLFVDRDFIVVQRLVCSNDPKSNAIRSSMLLAGLTLVVRSSVRFQTDYNPNCSKTYTMDRRMRFPILPMAVKADDGCSWLKVSALL